MIENSSGQIGSATPPKLGVLATEGAFRVAKEEARRRGEMLRGSVSIGGASAAVTKACDVMAMGRGVSGRGVHVWTTTAVSPRIGNWGRIL
jgi:hypothetical protein